MKLKQSSGGRFARDGDHRENSVRSQSVARRETKPTGRSQTPAKRDNEVEAEGGRIAMLETKLQRVMTLLTRFEEKEKEVKTRDEPRGDVGKVAASRRRAAEEESDSHITKSTKRKKFMPMNWENTQMTKPFEKYLTMKFDINVKRSVNPYDVIEEIRKETRLEAKVSTLNRTSFLIEAKNEEQSNKVTNIKKIKDYECTVEKYGRFNYVKGLIFLSEFEIEDLQEFKEGLQESYSVIEVEKASFIKSNSGSTAYVITFNQEYLPFSIYIPGERQDTRVQPFDSRPMICNTCQLYGHTAKRCSKEKVCKLCSESGHGKEECARNVEEFKCYHCSENHMVGSKVCQKQVREAELLRIQLQQKVPFRRALQIMSGEQETSKQLRKDFAHIFDCKMAENDKKKFLPWMLEKCLTNYLGGKPKCIRSKTKDTISIEIKTREEGEKIEQMKELNGCPVEIKPNNERELKALIYVKEYNMLDFDTYKKGLVAQFGLRDVVEASWIKTKDNRTKPLLLSLNGSEIPTYLDIPGEQERSRVYEYKKKPTMCQKCLEYGHRTKFCMKEMKCIKCYETTHKAEECQRELSGCYHCEGKHRTGSRMCSEYRYEEEIEAIQGRERVNRAQARLIFQSRTTIDRMNYAAILKKSGDRQPPIEDIGVESRGEEEPRAESRGPDKQGQGEANKNIEPPRAKTQVVCVSPTSGTLFTTTVEIEGIPKDAAEDMLPEDLLRETHQIFMEEDRVSTTQEQCNEDIRAYEEQLRKANKSKKGRRSRSRRSVEGSSSEESEADKQKTKRKKSKTHQSQERIKGKVVNLKET